LQHWILPTTDDQRPTTINGFQYSYPIELLGIRHG
jgi:hypothetical protein